MHEENWRLAVLLEHAHVLEKSCAVFIDSALWTSSSVRGNKLVRRHQHSFNAPSGTESRCIFQVQWIPTVNVPFALIFGVFTGAATVAPPPPPPSGTIDSSTNRVSGVITFQSMIRLMGSIKGWRYISPNKPIGRNAWRGNKRARGSILWHSRDRSTGTLCEFAKQYTAKICVQQGLVPLVGAWHWPIRPEFPDVNVLFRSDARWQHQLAPL